MASLMGKTNNSCSPPIRLAIGRDGPILKVQAPLGQYSIVRRQVKTPKRHPTLEASRPHAPIAPCQACGEMAPRVICWTPVYHPYRDPGTVGGGEGLGGTGRGWEGRSWEGCPCRQPGLVCVCSPRARPRCPYFPCDSPPGVD